MNQRLGGTLGVLLYISLMARKFPSMTPCGRSHYRVATRAPRWACTERERGTLILPRGNEGTPKDSRRKGNLAHENPSVPHAINRIREVPHESLGGHEARRDPGSFGDLVSLGNWKRGSPSQDRLG